MTETPNKQMPPEKKGPRAVFKALLVFALIGLIAFLYWFFVNRGTISTDDAYTTGNIVRIYPQTSGTVVEILADNTQSVKKGEVLVRLDVTDATLALEKAENNLVSATRAVASRLSQRDSLRAQVVASERQLELSQADYDRRRKLAPGTSITREELESYRVQVEVAKATLDAQKASLEASNRLIGLDSPEKDPAIRLAASELLSAWLNLERTSIKSPVNGRVARRSVQLGNQVSPGSPLMMVVGDTELWVDANFKESQLSKVRPGQRAEVRVDMLGGAKTFQGVVAGLSPGTGSVFSLLPTENATGNWIKVVQRVPVRVLIESGQSGGSPPLILGLSCHVKVYVDETVRSSPPSTWNYESDALQVDMKTKTQDIERTIERNLSFPKGELRAGELR
ncbi:MAG: efflux RND transporter periplasmic adaptor subunit [Deltaproteobacteria bacterium]|jgi:membrane fusion protein (multidrug efflux system)|nr:efflux RND transporter periplasmic adaptor subunit [Deltaproteobacteria bacterium]